MFRKVFVDSWKKLSITTLVKKLDLTFQVMINNDLRYNISHKKKHDPKQVSSEHLIQFNMESASFDLIFEDFSKVAKCPGL